MKFLDYLIDKLAKPPFDIEDIVRFEPDEHALGWVPPHPKFKYGYVGKVTRMVRGTTGLMKLEWSVYVDDINIGCSGAFYKLIRKRTPEDTQVNTEI